MATKKTAGIYARKSTDGQEFDRQMGDLREYVERADLSLVGEYLESVSGVSKERVELDRLMHDCRLKKIDVLVVDELSRLTRLGAREAHNLVGELDDLGVSLFVHNAPYLNTENQMARQILITVLAEQARSEREELSRRTRQGMAAAKKRGVHVGRPKASAEKIAHAKLLRDGGVSFRKIAQTVGLSLPTVFKHLKAAVLLQTQNENAPES